MRFLQFNSDYEETKEQKRWKILSGIIAVLVGCKRTTGSLSGSLIRPDKTRALLRPSYCKFSLSLRRMQMQAQCCNLAAKIAKRTLRGVEVIGKFKDRRLFFASEVRSSPVEIAILNFNLNIWICWPRILAGAERSASVNVVCRPIVNMHGRTRGLNFANQMILVEPRRRSIVLFFRVMGHWWRALPTGQFSNKNQRLQETSVWMKF